MLLKKQSAVTTKKIIRMGWFLLTLLSLFLCGEVLGRMVKISTEELVKEADHIVIGTVIGMESSWDAEGRWIRTYVSLSVEESIKGALRGKQVVISYIGGLVGEIGLWHSDTPNFKKGQRVFVFLQPDNRGAFKVVGRQQGKFTIMGGRIVEPNLSIEAFTKQIKTILKRQ